MKKLGVCKHISYQEFSETPEGHERWDNYMKQVTEIALQYPNIFFHRTAEEIIPRDARYHYFYAYVIEPDTITSFCIVIVYADQAELLWAASHKKRGHHMPELYRFIEGRLFSREYGVSRIFGMCCTEDTRIEENGQVIDGGKIEDGNWIRTHRFHEKMGYQFLYRLEDYWGEGSHAFVFMKRKDKGRYGYTKEFPLHAAQKLPKPAKDSHLEIHKLIQKQVREYLDIFDEDFVTNIPPATESKENTLDYIDEKKGIKGFTGIAFFVDTAEKAIMFAQRSVGDDEEEFEYRFEYPVHASTLTNLLANSGDSGVLYYPKEWDDQSDLKVGLYFDTFYPEMSKSDGFTIFYHRILGANGCFSVLYFITTEINNVVWYKPLWKSFSAYSFALIDEIYNYFQLLRLEQPELKTNHCLDGLVDCVSLSDVAEKKNIKKTRVDIQRRYEKYYQNLLDAKGSAIRHYGHTLKNRIQGLLTNLQDFSGNQTQINTAESLLEIAYILELSTVSSIDDIIGMDGTKKKQFLEFEDDGSWNILAELKESWLNEWGTCRMVDKICGEKKEYVYVQPHLCLDLSSCLLGFHQEKKVRLSKKIYRELFYEIFNNIMNYAHKEKLTTMKENLPLLVYKVWIRTAVIQRKKVLVITNLTSLIQDKSTGRIAEAKELPPYFKDTGSWERWSVNRAFDGPGMSIELLRRLDMGELYYQTGKNQDGARYFSVGIWLNGLELEQVEQGGA